MSIVRCEFCDKNIDTDFNLEHFSEGGVCMLELEQNHAKVENRLKETNEYLEILLSINAVEEGSITRVRECITMNNLALR